MVEKGRTGIRKMKWFLVAAYALLIFILSSISYPSQVIIPDIFMADKLLHFVEYGIFGFLLFAALYESMPVGRAVFISFAVASIYGATDEFHQIFVDNRNPDPFDFIADSFGGGAGTLAGALIKRRSF